MFLQARERGRMRFHKVQNCNAALQFLKYRKVRSEGAFQGVLQSEVNSVAKTAADKIVRF